MSSRPSNGQLRQSPQAVEGKNESETTARRLPLAVSSTEPPASPPPSPSGPSRRRYPDTIVINVGGTKYETSRSTLIAYPNSVLGLMVAEHHSKSNSGIEYFIDRDGELFRYVMQYYRYGRVFFREQPESRHAVTLEELEEEFRFYRIPFNSTVPGKQNVVSNEDPVEKAVASKLDAFVMALRDLLVEVFSSFESRIDMTFTWRKMPPEVRLSRGTHRAAHLYERANAIMLPFGSVGAKLFDIFHIEIEAYIKDEIPDVAFKGNKNYSVEIGEFYNASFVYSGEFNRNRIVSSSKLPQFSLL